MFEIRQKVLFRHCDPAGIVFFPRYFEMMNDCVEAFFDQGLNCPFEQFHQTAGIPTATITTTFTSPGRHGDMLDLRLNVTRVGRASFDYEMSCYCGKIQRFLTNATLVQIDLNGKPTPLQNSIKQRLIDFIKVSS
ncbi:MAG TPA: thioesterase [Rhodobacteraceae bacterium]|nr:hotdog domain-containing protein [Planktomarina sp.]HBR63892.1 thioesterase [Paracoccaceae bacterium]